MTQVNMDIQQIKQIRQSLHDESIEVIDFDRLDEILKQSSTLVEMSRAATKELEILKNDYRNRIIGMLKAILACREDVEISELAARLTDEDNEIDSTELMRLYCRAAATFRAPRSKAILIW